MNRDDEEKDFRATSRWVRERGGEGNAPPSLQEQAVLDEVLRGMRRVRHGSIQLQLQDSRVLQIDVTEKHRL